MEYVIKQENNAMNIVLKGQFTFSDNLNFKHIIDAIEQNEAKSINLDFAQVDFIDSAGLGMMLLLRDLCQNRHIPVSITAAHGQVERIFMISKFDQLFTFAA